jgi:hypothetical protein
MPGERAPLIGSLKKSILIKQMKSSEALNKKLFEKEMSNGLIIRDSENMPFYNIEDIKNKVIRRVKNYPHI